MTTLATSAVASLANTQTVKKRGTSHSNAESRRLLDEYKAAAAASTRERQRLQMSSSAGGTRQTAAVTSFVMDQFDAAMANEQYDEALSCLLEAVRLGEVSHDVLFNIGALMQHGGRHDEAIEYFTKAIHRDPLHSEDYLRRSECYAAKQMAAEAFRELEKYFKLEAPQKALLVKCGKFALDADLLTEAERYLLEALETDGDADATNNAYANFNLGELYERLGRDADAKARFDQVCVLDPDFPTPYFKQAVDEYESANYPLALHLFEAVAKMQPDNAKVYVHLADVYSNLGAEFTSSVLTCLTKAIDLSDPQDAVFQTTLVRRGYLLYTENEDYDQAICDFTVCLDANAENSAALLHRAAVYRLRLGDGDFDAAIADYVTVAALDIDWQLKAEPFRVLGEWEVSRGNATAAATYLALSACWCPLEPQVVPTAIAVFAQKCNATAFDEAYEPRAYVQVKDEKGKKAADQAPKPYPVTSWSHQIIDSEYTAVREQEPTVHSAVEAELVAHWKPVHDEVERAREEAEAIRGGKRPKKGK